MPHKTTVLSGAVDFGWVGIRLVVEARGAESSVFCTETRVVTTDSESRSRFRQYWSVVSPGLLLIRREVLKLVSREAERRVREPDHQP